MGHGLWPIVSDGTGFHSLWYLTIIFEVMKNGKNHFLSLLLGCKHVPILLLMTCRLAIATLLSSKSLLAHIKTVAHIRHFRSDLKRFDKTMTFLVSQ